MTHVMTQSTRNKNTQYDPSKLEAYLRLNPKANNDVLYSLCGASTDSEKGYIRKKKSRILDRIEVSESPLNEVLDSEKSKVYPKKKHKDIIHDTTKNHALELIQKYYDLPLFIYSKLFERIDKEYIRVDTLSHDEMEVRGLDYDTGFEKLNYSLFDMYMELFEEINKGNYNQEIEIFMKDVLQSYGTIYCKEHYDLPFSKAKLEEVSYWSEEEAKGHITKMVDIEHPKNALEYNWSEKQLSDINEWTINHAKMMIEEGMYTEDYSNVVNEVSEAIAFTLDHISNMLEFYKPLTIDMVRVIPLAFIMFDLRPFNVFDSRPNEYIRGDILKLYIEMRRKKIPLGYIPCAVDYHDNIKNVFDMYREYDIRWFGMNDPEKFLQYKTDPTKE